MHQKLYYFNHPKDFEEVIEEKC